MLVFVSIKCALRRDCICFWLWFQTTLLCSLTKYNAADKFTRCSLGHLILKPNKLLMSRARHTIAVFKSISLSVLLRWWETNWNHLFLITNMWTRNVRIQSSKTGPMTQNVLVQLSYIYYNLIIRKCHTSLNLLTQSVFHGYHITTSVTVWSKCQHGKLENIYRYCVAVKWHFALTCKTTNTLPHISSNLLSTWTIRSFGCVKMFWD